MMQQQTCLQQQPQIAPAAATRCTTNRLPRRSAMVVRAQKQQEAEQQQMSRRQGLMAAAAGLAMLNVGSAAMPAIAEESKMIPVDSLSVFQRKGQKSLMLTRALDALKQELTAADAPSAVRAVLHEAMTYDIATKTGGVNGSIVLPEELNRPENAGLKPYVEKLATAKKAIDAGAAEIGQSPISWADMLVLGARVATQKTWYDIKVGSSTLESGGKVIAENFATEFPVTLGRVDATTADPAGRVPSDGAPVEELRAFMSQLGAKPAEGPFKPKPPFWERPAFVVVTAAAADPKAEEARWAEAAPELAKIKRKYDLSRNTVTRTDYEVDFVEYLNKLGSLGAKFDPDAYLFPVALQLPKKL